MPTTSLLWRELSLLPLGLEGTHSPRPLPVGGDQMSDKDPNKSDRTATIDSFLYMDSGS